MSRIGKQPIKIPSGVKVNVQGAEVHFEGPKGKTSHTLPKGTEVALKENVLTVTKDVAVVNSAALFGLTRTLLNNCVQGVTEGFTKVLEINGVGYRAQVQGSNVNFTLGFSHPVLFPLPQGISAKVEKNTTLSITGIDKELVGRVAAKIKALRPVEPYQGKGIRYQGQRVLRKQGKAAGAKTA